MDENINTSNTMQLLKTNKEKRKRREENRCSHQDCNKN